MERPVGQRREEPRRPGAEPAVVRNLPFGRAGMLTYLVLDYEQRVDVLLIAWAG